MRIDHPFHVPVVAACTISSQLLVTQPERLIVPSKTSSLARGPCGEYNTSRLQDNLTYSRQRLILPASPSATPVLVTAADSKLHFVTYVLLHRSPTALSRSATRDDQRKEAPLATKSEPSIPHRMLRGVSSRIGHPSRTCVEVAISGSHNPCSAVLQRRT